MLASQSTAYVEREINAIRESTLHAEEANQGMKLSSCVMLLLISTDGMPISGDVNQDNSNGMTET